MRIAVLSRNFSSSGGGAERYSIALVEQLAARHEVHVFAQTIAHQLPGVHYHQVPMPLRKPRWINQLWFAYATWKATREGFDIVHSHENTWHGNVQTVHVLPVKHTLFVGKSGVSLALRWLKVATSPRLLAYLWLEKARYRLQPNRKVVLTSDTLRAVMLSAYPHSKPMLHCIPPGVKDAPGPASPEAIREARVKLHLPEHVFLLLFVGNDMRKKGLPTLLDALRLLSGVHLAVVGNGEHLPEMRERAQALDGRVHFLGAMQQVDVAYVACNCLVHPTLEDTYAMVVLEAMAHGLPVIVSNSAYCGIAAELQNEGNALLLSDPRAPQEIVGDVQKILKETELTSRLQVNAHAFAGARTWSRVGRAHEALFVLEDRHD